MSGNATHRREHVVQKARYYVRKFICESMWKNRRHAAHSLSGIDAQGATASVHVVGTTATTVPYGPPPYCSFHLCMRPTSQTDTRRTRRDISCRWGQSKVPPTHPLLFGHVFDRLQPLLGVIPHVPQPGDVLRQLLDQTHLVLVHLAESLQPRARLRNRGRVATAADKQE